MMLGFFLLAAIACGHRPRTPWEKFKDAVWVTLFWAIFFGMIALAVYGGYHLIAG